MAILDIERPPRLDVARAPRGESVEYHARRTVDPLEVVDADAAVLASLISMSTEGLATSVASENGGETVEFSADLAYRLFSAGDHVGAIRFAKYGAKTAMQELERTDISPAKRLALNMRLLDFRSVQAFSSYEKDKGTRTPAEEKDTLKILEATSKRVINDGVAMLNDAQKQHEASTDPKVQQKLRGSMFELFYTTYRRLGIYEAEDYDRTLVLGATDFEDRSAPAAEFEKNHNYDVLVVNSRGAVQEVVQCKNAEDDKRYERPIKKVTGQGFGKFIDDPWEYLQALDKLVANPVDISEDRMVRYRDSVSGLFVSPLQLVGGTAVNNAF